MSPDDLTPAEQLALLLAYGVDVEGRRYSSAAIAEAAELSTTTLQNILTEKTSAPRLSTIRALCRVYGISIDYFDLSTEPDCLRYLERHRRQVQPLYGQIMWNAGTLSPELQRQLLRIAPWIEQGKARLSP